ncbi:MAG: hypothetical protein Q9227_005285 [Pyrenula ochraceoflavens]
MSSYLRRRLNAWMIPSTPTRNSRSSAERRPRNSYISDPTSSKRRRRTLSEPKKSPVSLETISKKYADRFDDSVSSSADDLSVNSPSLPTTPLYSPPSSASTSHSLFQDPFIIQPSTLLEKSSGIDWIVATPGQSLLASARFLAMQNSLPRIRPHQDQATVIRRMFIDAVSCLLQALPQELTAEESSRVYGSLPEDVRENLQTEESREIRQQLGILHFDEEKSCFRQLVAKAFLLAALLCAMILPFIIRLAQWAYQQERKHRITNRLFVTALNSVDQLGEGCLDAKDSITAFQRGRFGAAVSTWGMYVADGVGGGVRDGITQGCSILGNALIESDKI